MPASKKPRKKYRQKPVVNGLNARDPWAVEGDVHAMLMCLEAGQVEEVHLAMLAAHADMVRRLCPAGTPEHRQAETVIRVLAEIQQRPELRVLSGEAAAIRAAVTVTLPAIRRASNLDIYRISTASLRDFDRRGGIPLSLST